MVKTTAKLITTTSLITSSIQQIRQSECAFFHYNNWALMLWVIASVFCFVAFLTTIYTIYNAYKLWATIQDLENSVVDLIDDACQILLPLGVCKQICHPHHIGTVNANYVPKGHKEEQKPGRKENRYPEDVTFPPSDIEKVYDVMGDEEARKSKSLSVSTVQLPPAPSEKKEESQPKARTPLRATPSKEPVTPQKTPIPSKEPTITPQKTLIPSKEPLVTPQKTPSKEPVHSDKKKPSLKTTPTAHTPKASAEKTPTRRGADGLSREPMTARSGSSRMLENGSKRKTNTPQKVAVKAKSPNNFAMKASAEASANPNPE